MRGRSRPVWVAVSVGVVAVVGVAVGLLVAGSRPAIPAGAAAVAVTRTALTGAITPDATEGIDPDDLPRSPAGQVCLPRIERPAGWLDLCWEAYRDPHDDDPASDYYVLRVYGSFEGGGTRWLVVRSRLLDAPNDNVFQAWPDGVIEGACRSVEARAFLVVPAPLPPQELCGRTTGVTATEDWTHTVTWTCERCLLPDASTKGIALYNVVAVPAGTVPSWDLFADLGG